MQQETREIAPHGFGKERDADVLEGPYFSSALCAGDAERLG
jgi:hypothetical protein